MELKTFSPDNTPRRILPDPAISITKGGRIGFNYLAVEQLKLSDGNNVIFHQDEQKNWYLQTTKAKGFRVVQHSSKSSVYIQSIYISNLLKDGAEGGMRFLIGKPFEEKGIQLFPLLKQ